MLGGAVCIGTEPVCAAVFTLLCHHCVCVCVCVCVCFSEYARKKALGKSFSEKKTYLPAEKKRRPTSLIHLRADDVDRVGGGDGGVGESGGAA